MPETVPNLTPVQELLDLPEAREFQQLVPTFEFRDLYDADVRSQNTALVRAASEFWEEAVRDPGSHRLTEFMYQNTSTKPLDQWLPRLKSFRAVSERLTRTVQIVDKLVATHTAASNGHLTIGSLGSGPGRDVLAVMNSCQNELRATLVDVSSEAVDEGKRLAKQAGLVDRVEFVRQDFLKYRGGRFDIALLIGVLCPHDRRHCRAMLRCVMRNMREGGILVASNASVRMAREDTFGRFLMEYLADWRLVYKDQEELAVIMAEAGLKVLRIDQEPYGYHLLGLGVKPGSHALPTAGLRHQARVEQ